MSAERPIAQVSARIPLFVLAVANARGVPRQELADAAGLRIEELERPDARIPLEAELALWSEAARRTGDPLFGLHAAQAWRPGQFDVLEYVCRSAGSLRAAIERVARYNRLLHDIAEFRLEESEREARVIHRFRGELAGPVREAAEFTLASAFFAARLWTGKPLSAVRVDFMHPDPGDVRELADFFGTTHIGFGAKESALVLRRADLDLPLIAADPGLCAVLERHADALLTALPKVESFGARVRELIAGELRSGTPTAGTVAARLHMSERTLHRRLAEEGLRFGDEVDSLRQGLAYRYLEDPRLQIAEVAFLLGYSEASAFHRAFKSWTGGTPGAWRERHLPH
ncbi:AraC family transcriptional regulator [Vulgatibacter incomptus]|uniref:Transcriptional regulator, AraC family n=1 Tax=Vulgatibacter incomptus TaxID=1391653 RepID=A0A0K1PDP2_9BACT|nr:AraC family transcriptional regulator [Vulgatibacter incomptus]AKU91640.1 Transcriptional regulator, AraC family [Vulgatibacter incomptus]